MFTAFLEPYSTSTSLLVLLPYSLFSDTYHILSHIVSHLLLLSATNNFLSLTLLSSIFFHVQLLVYYDATGLSPSSVLHSLAHIPFPFLTPNPFLSATLLLITFLIISTPDPSITTSDKL